MTEVTEPDANERSDQRPNKCRVTFNPTRWVYLSDGEMHDHRVWGTLLEDPDGMVETAAQTAADEDSAVTAKTGADPADTATGTAVDTAQTTPGQANTAAEPDSGKPASAPAAKGKTS